MFSKCVNQWLDNFIVILQIQGNNYNNCNRHHYQQRLQHVTSLVKSVQYSLSFVSYQRQLICDRSMWCSSRTSEKYSNSLMVLSVNNCLVCKCTFMWLCKLWATSRLVLFFSINIACKHFKIPIIKNFKYSGNHTTYAIKK